MKKELNLNCYKTVGFYFSVVSMILLILSMVLYKTKFTGILSEYYSNVVFIPAIIGLVLSVILLIFNKTSKYSPIVLWVCTFISFLLFIQAIYMYFTGVFYNGVTSEAIALINKGVLVSVVFYLITCVISNIAVWLKQSKD
ncbi:MAG TPA: hypothetical protein DIU44_01560 [Acholeplasmatales bacterium]|jgi:hypothetical protein|nr:hypothetical membrane protein conserved [Clostridium sp. CAG:307]HCS24590.1 hypothetical protein [Acholeplasmatales bacterium]